MHTSDSSKKTLNACLTTFLVVAIFTIAVLFLSFNTQGTLSSYPEGEGPTFISAHVQETVLMTLNLNNGTGENYTNALLSITFTFHNVSNFQISQIIELGLFNESHDSTGFDSQDERIDTTTPPNIVPGQNESTYQIFVDGGVTLPSQVMKNATFYLVLLDGSGLVENAVFNVSIEIDAIVTQDGSGPATVAMSGPFT
ncbi:MAG TPA: hypothetical protein ENN76_01040, partial [Euryarchaeota archaeon]|nr:hypothetical protein [Euryarchaeota archaeon]